MIIMSFAITSKNFACLLYVMYIVRTKRLSPISYQNMKKWLSNNNIRDFIVVFNLLSQTVSRASSRKSRPESSGSRLERFGPGSDHSESDDEIPHKPREHLPEIADFTTVDINDEKAFDTDLEDKGTSLLLLKGQSIVIMILKTSPVVLIRKYFIFSNS